MNSVQLIGRLTHEPDPGHTPNGTPVTTFRLAVDRPSLVAVFCADHVYRMDVRQMIDFHNDRRADVTVAAIPMPASEANQFGASTRWRSHCGEAKLSQKSAALSYHVIEAPSWVGAGVPS